MRHGSLFSGIGGFDLAAEWMGWENVFQVEKDKFCTKVLEKNFPNVKRYGDIKEFDGSKYKGLVDIISGGIILGVFNGNSLPPRGSAGPSSGSLLSSIYVRLRGLAGTTSSLSYLSRVCPSGARSSILIV